MVNVPYFKPHVRFLPHFVEWYAANKIKHDLHSNWQMYRALHHAQNEGLFLAKKLQCTHILWTEDDHFRFPVDGLEVLLDADLDVVGFSSYKKKYPYSPINFRKSDKRISLTSGKPNLQPFYQGDGPEVQPCDLIGWNFLLTKIEVFDKLKRDPFEKWAFSPTDSHFCQYCLDVGIQPHVHFGWVIGHGDVPPEEIVFHRRMQESVNASKGRFPLDAMPSARDEDFDERVIETYVPAAALAVNVQCES